MKLARIGIIPPLLLVGILAISLSHLGGFHITTKVEAYQGEHGTESAPNIPDPIVHTKHTARYDLKDSEEDDSVVTLDQPELGRRAVAPLNEFVQTVKDGDAATVAGIYSPGLFALYIKMQPDGNSIYVTEELNEVTLYDQAARNGVTGLLAHNTRAGKFFYQLDEGSELDLIYGDGKIRSFVVKRIKQYKKVDPLDLRSDYVDVENGERVDSNKIFETYYTGSERVTLQTCLERFHNVNWGLEFIEAYPLPQNPF